MLIIIKLSWYGVFIKENQVIINYILNTEGTWKKKSNKVKSAMENQMHRVIKYFIWKYYLRFIQ